MIKLTLPNKPAKLTAELEQELIERFKIDQKDPVWQRKFIKSAVFKIAYGKCAYSEVKLYQEGKDMQIDHFYPKNIYKDKVVEWGNLLPSLNYCNRSKWNIDLSVVGLINPLVDDPKRHLYFVKGYLYAKSTKGKNTIKCLNLDDMQRLLRPRTLLLREVENTLKDLEAWINKDINHFMRRLKEIMLRGTKRYAYSAAVSTCILSNDNYIAYRNYLHTHGLWNLSFRIIEDGLRFCSLPK